ncbi:MAG: FAD-binding oxidoreductase [Opitutales bacterium]|nr:FAD-binding oxidoreductase [Opitutales bacterium]
MKFFSQLRDVYPPDRLLLKDGPLSSYQSDGLTAFAVKPLAVVIPESANEVIETVRLCHREGVPFVARGSGTSLSGGSLPVVGGIIIALNRLNRILALDAKQRIARVEPGVINLDVSRAAQPHGLRYAPDPSSEQICTIGGNLAFNAGGAHCLKYGMTSNHVIGIRAVLATGEEVEFGGDGLENVGPDWTALFVGSEGLFGIALEITLRLVPAVETFHTALVAYDSLESAGQAVSSIVAAGILPGALEIMDPLAIEAAEAAVHAGYPKGAKAILIVELEGPREQLFSEIPKLEAILDASGSREIRIAADDRERSLIWKGRKSAFSAVGRLSPDFIVQDGVVPRARLGEALAEVVRLGHEHGLRVANVFHAGDGNLHPLILYDGNEEGSLERAEILAGKVLQMCARMGGSITGEHGIGMEKRDYLGDMFNEDDIALMKRVRGAFDPKHISNPGKMFPGKEAPVLAMRGLHPLEKDGLLSRE